MATTPLGLELPPDSTKISKFAEAHRTLATKADAILAAQNTKVQSVVDRANAGEFKGNKGDKGDPGASWVQPRLAANSNIDALPGPAEGAWPIWTFADADSMTPDLPELGTGELIQYAQGTYRTQYWDVNGGGLWKRGKQAAWATTWTRIDRNPMDAWNYTRLPVGQDINLLTIPGYYGVWSDTDADTMTNLPVGFKGGLIRVTRMGAQIYHKAYRYANDHAEFTREGTTAGFFGWRRTDAAGVVLPSFPDISTAPRSGFKSAYLALNVPETSGTETNTSQSIRFPLWYGVPIKRLRLHIRNWSTGSSAAGTVYTGAVNFTGAWFGKAIAGNQFKDGVRKQVLPAFTTPANGSEYVSPWFDVDIQTNGRDILALGFTTPAGHVQAKSRGGCWRTGSAADADLATGYTGTYSNFSPFDVWLEAEVPAATPIVAGVGDSNTAATGTFMPVYDSWLSAYCRQASALPYFMAIHGATADTWDTKTDAKWNRFTADIARPDSAIHFLGRNNMQPGVTLPTLQANFKAVVDIIREKLTPVVYAATITPSNTETPEVQALRRSYNTWLASKPEGVHDCFDFVSAVSDDDATIRAADNADGLHFKITGHEKVAAKVLERPVNPRVLTQTETTALLALLA